MLMFGELVPLEDEELNSIFVVLNYSNYICNFCYLFTLMLVYFSASFDASVITYSDVIIFFGFWLDINDR